MHFLKQFLSKHKICIQCHDNPDADTVASAFGVYRYLTAHGVCARMIYGGAQPVKKSAMRLLLKECGIPLEHVQTLPDCELLLLADCQYGQGNVQPFEAPAVAVIDHHTLVSAEDERHLIRPDRQSCSTLVWEMLCEEGYPVAEDRSLTVALLYGLYTDTSCFADLFTDADMAMRRALSTDDPLFEQLTKSNMSIAELLVASDALHNHYFDPARRFAIVEALSCDQTILGVIGDLMIQVDAVLLSFSYTRAGDGYQISLRACGEGLPANRIAAFVCEGVGSGGGHARKAGGYIQQQSLRQIYGDASLFDVVNRRLCAYFDALPHAD